MKGTISRIFHSLRTAHSPHREVVASGAGFTLIELLIVIATLALLALAVIYVLQPGELLRQSRDATRLTNLETLNKAMNLYTGDVRGGYTGSSSVIYVSIPDTDPQCGTIGLPPAPTGTPNWTYHCSPPATYRKIDGTGWLPVDFTQISYGSVLEKLPIDPVNTVASGYYYTYVVGSWELNASFESLKYRAKITTDGGDDATVFEVGSDLKVTPVLARAATTSTLSAYCSVSPSTIAINSTATWSGGAFGGNGTYAYSWSGHTEINAQTGQSVSPTYAGTGTRSGMVSVTSDTQTATSSCANSLNVVTALDQPPVAIAKISTDGISYYPSITVTQGVSSSIYLSSASSSDPDGWTNPTNGVSSGGFCEWNRDLNQGTPTYEAPSSTNPLTPGACNTSLGTMTFNDSPGIYTYTVLKLSDNQGIASAATIQITVSAVPDTNPPARSGGSPVGSLPSGTTTSTLSLTTDESATCKYGVTSSTPYASMPTSSIFSSTGGTSHSQPLVGLTNSSTYTYYVRCSDTSSNVNTTDYPIPFSVSAPAANQAPVAQALIATSTSNTYLSTITLTQNVTTTLYFTASGSSDPDGWTNPTNGISTSGFCEWNRDLNQGTPTYEAPSSTTPTSSLACNTSGSRNFTSTGTFAITLLRLTDNAGLQSTSSVSVTVNPPPDVTPPVRSNGAPSSTLPINTTSTTISLTTDENSTCKYGTVASTSYASLPTTFTNTSSTSHTSVVTGLTNSSTFTYYVRCQDGSGNPNTNDYPITFSISGVHAPAWYNNEDASWPYRIPLTIQAGQVSGTQTNFPIYVNLANLSATNFFSQVQASGTDIVVTASNGTTKLDRQLVAINKAGNTGELWFRATSTTNGSVFYLYYGKVAGAEVNTAATWDANYKGVWHLNEAPANGAAGHLDSTSNANTGTPQNFNGTTTSTTNGTGKIGVAPVFDGVNDYVNIPNSASLSITGDITIEGWTQYYAGGWQMLFNKYLVISPNSGYALANTNGFTSAASFWSSGCQCWTFENNWPGLAWRHVAATLSGTNLTLYWNGVADGTSTITAPDTSTATASIGSLAGNSFFMNGSIDEVRVSNSARSAGWILTEYNNQNLPSSFYAVGSQQPF